VPGAALIPSTLISTLMESLHASHGSAWSVNRVKLARLTRISRASGMRYQVSSTQPIRAQRSSNGLHRRRPQKTSDPARALASLLARNQFFTSEFAREAAALPACEPPLPISAGRVYSDICESCHCNGDAMWRSGLSRYRTSPTRHANLLTACCGERPIRRGL